MDATGDEFRNQLTVYTPSMPDWHSSPLIGLPPADGWVPPMKLFFQSLSESVSFDCMKMPSDSFTVPDLLKRNDWIASHRPLAPFGPTIIPSGRLMKLLLLMVTPRLLNKPVPVLLSENIPRSGIVRIPLTSSWISQLVKLSSVAHRPGRLVESRELAAYDFPAVGEHSAECWWHSR